ncbi:putative hydro-lyase [Sulfitobacter sp. S190]|uniref:putative hydro-lyase n=1 Tax=Sulfitobacter sp. S190 TaxID=2867022 RepID=UPI0021A298DD|nr:putative hydro-lyase [Sulfitobacter sp. S190]UWR21730.1 putative hydro-lyase [Sulfitobacter sp. S190]
MNQQFEELKSQSTRQVRAQIRACAYAGHTAGLGKDNLQANLAILPAAHALDFMRFCQRNPKPCPLVGVSDTGVPQMTTLGRDIDIRTDLPAYYVYRDGVLVDAPQDITDLWQDDFVAFALGCSFTFEHALERAGIKLWHIANNTTVPMFASNIPTVSAGPFGGATVVSMRAIPDHQVAETIEISNRFPMAHGGPLHVGDPAQIGIADLDRPDWGDRAPVPEGTTPVFWACGVTPQVAIMRAGLPICITHKPGAMLITDVADDAETTILRP